MKKIRIAQIGTSVYSHGANVIESLRKQSDIFEVVGYALPENEREKEPTIRLSANPLPWIYNYHHYRNASPYASYLLVKRRDDLSR